MPPTEHIEKYSKARYANVVECVQGHYESEKVPFGRVYRWPPECVMAECGCGERATLTSSMTICGGCGTDHAAIVQEWLPIERVAGTDEARRPWRLVGDCEDESLPC